MIEVPQVSELVAERVDQTRVLERLAGRDMAQPNSNRAVGVTNAVAVFDVRAFGLDAPVLQAKLLGDPEPVAVQLPN